MGTVAMSLATFIFLVNVIALIYLMITRVIFFCRVRKARKAFLKVRVRRNAIRLPSWLGLIDDNFDLDQARDQEQIREESE